MNYLTERVEQGSPLHIYINSDKWDNENNIVVSYDNENPSFSMKLNGEHIEEQIDYLMGLLGRDTRNWGHADIILHWGNHTWKFYNEMNISDFTKEEYNEFGIDKNDYDNLR